ncbi:MAG: LLM class flavin-dependent oxidoreductase [Alphaproteobacteria bacterium]|jgi:FMN-dependent oxidoreductase (nitrilotriacetate monooxygenase family)|nr:LLM class flavin-dependent oxidoreductase [Alphaproteobacteria bacterium]MDP6831448.1 LLM class flavin-dependent oxidoreductase [Alphaproteobacteria bacterium]
MAAKQMHLAQFLVHGPTYHSQAMWRHPETAARNYDWSRPDLYQHIAQVCERGLFDMVFFADLNNISDTYRGSLEPALRYAAQAPEHDPLPLLSFIAAATSHIGLGATLSVSHHQPFYAARLWATLDHLTRGRAAWNVVTSLNHNQAANYGEERQDADARYERAEEFMEVCQKLWRSWEEDAVVMDRQAPIFADAAKVHRIEHVGKYFKSRGPLNVVRSPQCGPAILQAGTSPKGMDFAARHADGIFAIQPRAEDAAKYFAEVKGRMAKFGREPDQCRIFFGAQPIIGASESEAREKQEEHNSLVTAEGGMTILSAHLDFDLSRLDPGEEMAARKEPELQRLRTRYHKASGEPMTVAEVAQRHGQSVGLPQFVGTPKSVADQMQVFMEAVGGDGFMLSPIHCPGAIEEFVDLVVPELQRRGLFRTEYSGAMLGDHLR